MRLALALIALLPAIALQAQTPETEPAPEAQVTASSQPTEGEGEVVQMQAFSITGSNIKRMDQEKVLPVTVFNSDAMDIRNAVTPVAMLTALPQVTNVPLGESSNAGLGARGDNANVNMRGIGSGNTLILLNGRRLAPHPITTTENDAPSFSVNVNQLPNRGIERVDVLRDGASAVYGSDAVAGVINYITRRDFRGTEIRTRFGVPEHGGGAELGATLTYGLDFNGGKGRWLTTLDYLYRDAIYYRDRDFSKTGNNNSRAAAPFNTKFDFRGATGGPYVRFSVDSSTVYFRPLAGASSTPGLTTVAPTLAANPEYYNDVNLYQMGQPRGTRVNWFNGVEYDVTDTITAFVDLSYYQAQSTLVRQTIPLNYPSSDSEQVVLSINNPFNPYGSRFYDVAGAANADGSARITGAPRTILIGTQAVKDVGQEHIQIASSVYRIVGGLRGKFGRTWTWESAALYTHARTKDSSVNQVRGSLLQQAAQRTDATAYNPFGYTFKVENGAVVADREYVNPASTLSTFVRPFNRIGTSSVGSLDFRTGGEVVDIWSGAVSVATGGEFRKEDFRDYREDYAGLNPAGSGLSPLENDFLQASPKPNSEGKRDVISAYAETVVPLVAPKNNIPGIHSLELTASGRFERYSDFGNTTKPKVGLNWKPVDLLMIRASYNKGFRAPNLPTLYAPSQYSVDSAPGTIDPYRNSTIGTTGEIGRIATDGNPNLKPEESTGKSIGFVFTVPKVKNLTFTADYWKLDQKDVIGSDSSELILANDTALLNAYIAQQLAAGATVGSINLGSGTAAYKGDPRIVRLAVTPGDQALFNARNAVAAGAVYSRTSAYVNRASGSVSGWDLGVNYALPNTSFGRFNFSSDWAYMIESYTMNNGVVQQRLNVNGSTRWRGNGTLSWRKRAWTAGLSAYYIGKFQDTATAASTTKAIYESLGRPTYIAETFDNGIVNYRYIINDSITYNAFVGYAFPKGGSKWLSDTSVRLGLVNALDKVPPLAGNAVGFTSSVYGGLLAGRTWTLEFTKRF